MTNPIWVVDPTGNNNPYLEILPPALFVASSGAFENVQGITANPKFWWSSDGFNWNQSNFDSSAFPDQLFASSLQYASYSWACKFANNNTFFGSYAYSPDGKNWRIVYTEDGTLGQGTLSFEGATNSWIVSFFGQHPTVVVTIAANVNPLNATVTDDEPGLLADPSQTAVPAQNTAVNSLPPGITAMRFGTAETGDNVTFQVTATAITSTVVNSGANWPAATWQTVFGFGNPGADASNNTISYGPVVA